MRSILKNSISIYVFLLIATGFSTAQINEVVIQNGLNEYNGCEDMTYIEYERVANYFEQVENPDYSSAMLSFFRC